MAKVAALLTAEKITLLLSLIPYLVDRGCTPISQVAHDFDVDAHTIRSLLRFLGTAGIPGDTATYQHDDLFDIDWDALELRDEACLTKTVVVDDVPRLAPREVSALVAGLQLLRRIPELSSPEEIAELTRKLTGVAASAPPRVEITVRPVPAAVRVIRDALESDSAVSFDYRDVDGTPSSRTVQPKLIETLDEVWYLHGWCADRRAARVFRLDRMSNVVSTAAVEGSPHDPALSPSASPRFSLNPDDSVIVNIRVLQGRLPNLRAFDAEFPRSTAQLTTSPNGRDVHVEGTVTLALAERAPHLVRAAPGAIEIVSPMEARAAVVDWAARALAQYDV